MKGIYLTEQAKQEIEAKIAELIIELKSSEETDEYGIGSIYAALGVYEKILSSATILPVEESWKDVYDMLSINTLPNHTYKNGVIIEPKK